jgi:hypothetical protein
MAKVSWHPHCHLLLMLGSRDSLVSACFFEDCDIHLLFFFFFWQRTAFGLFLFPVYAFSVALVLID